MPEFGEFFSFYDKLELAVKTQTPRQLAQHLKTWSRTEYDLEKVDKYIAVMFDLIVKHHGPLGDAEFIQELGV